VSAPEDQSTKPASIFARHRVAFAVGGGALAFVLLATGALFAGAAVGSSNRAASQTPDESAAPVDTARVVPAEIPASNPVRTCTINSLAKDKTLMDFSGQVVNLDTGDVLFDRDGDQAARTGSLLKLITATAALQVLGPDATLKTYVYAGDTPGTVVLVGEGDPTLSRTPVGQESYYPGAPKLQTLADAVIAASDPAVPITNIIVDASYWSTDDKWLDSWKRSEQTTGYLSEVTALQVDGDRKNPKKAVSPRSTDPVTAAGTYFAKALGVPSATITVGTKSAGAAELAQVESQPIADLINQMLLTSDGTLAESIARVTSKVAGENGSAASLQTVMTGQLSALGLDVSNLGIVDGSGLSADNAVSPEFFNQLIALLKQGQNNLNIVYNSLPVAGETGSLASRFTGANAKAKGAVIAKTGWIDTEYALGGVVNAEDGTTLAFTFYAIGDGITKSANTALDTLAAAVYSCGDNLSNR
jgi:D-alanyl-D-alanine carboxypeptidase/D-alanyl-D-alanine-endopeptidase (penicillin-binding protein 4)